MLRSKNIYIYIFGRQRVFSYTRVFCIHLLGFSSEHYSFETVGSFAQNHSVYLLSTIAPIYPSLLTVNPERANWSWSIGGSQQQFGSFYMLDSDSRRDLQYQGFHMGDAPGVQRTTLPAPHAGLFVQLLSCATYVLRILEIKISYFAHATLFE